MDVKTANAAFAYADALARATEVGEGAGAAKPQTGPSFAEMLSEVKDDVVQQIGHGEQMSVRALAGEVDLVDIVTAVTNAEVTLQTVVALRDKMVQAYQQIIRMPI